MGGVAGKVARSRPESTAGAGADIPAPRRPAPAATAAPRPGRSPASPASPSHGAAFGPDADGAASATGSVTTRQAPMSGAAASLRRPRDGCN